MNVRKCELMRLQSHFQGRVLPLAPLLTHWGLLFPEQKDIEVWRGSPHHPENFTIFLNNAFLSIFLFKFLSKIMFLKFLIYYLLPWPENNQ